MHRWEYLRVTVHYKGWARGEANEIYINGKEITNRKDLIKVHSLINSVGKAGWELVSVTTEESEFETFCFKRPIESPNQSSSMGDL